MLTLTEKKVRILRNILIIGSVLAGIKMLFFDYTLDEEYQIVMAYRNILGDHLFVQMWEPHQSSAFMCTILMKAYLWMFGTTTGVVLFLRGCTAVIHLSMSIYFYRVVCRITKKEYGFLLALVYFNIYPKLIPIPEFSLMQVWFFTLVILFPFFGAVIGIRSKRSRIRDCLLFITTCVAAGAVYLFLILRHIQWEELLRNADNIIHGDLTHHFMTQEKVITQSVKGVNNAFSKKTKKPAKKSQ